jgi:CRISPR-associated protein Csy3
VTKGLKPEIEQQHYVMAVLIRGGVFGEKGD